MQQQPNLPVVEWCKQELQRFAAVLETSLQGRNYLVEDGPTLADYAVAHIEPFVDQIGFDWSPYPQISAYYERMRNNPYWAATAAVPEEMGRRP